MPVNPKRPRKARTARSVGNRGSHVTSRSNPLCVVGIGASAGGFDAIVEFLRAMPTDSGMAFVIVQHLGNSPRSLSAELFANRTAMPVRVAENGLRLQANCVYTNPADRDIRIQAGCIRLSKPMEPHGWRLPIDHLFRSLGQDQRERAVGIILSGTGNDGTLGLKEIVTNGGIVLVQAPESCQYDSMPRSAMATGMVAHALPVAKMPRALLTYARHPYVRKRAAAVSATAAGNPLRTILELLRRRHGQSFIGYKQRMLMRRIERRMGLLGIEKIDEYVKRLRRDTKELGALHKDLLIGVTEFFRDRKAWAALETQVLRPLIASKKNGEPIRAWVAGASTGEEAYTLTMLILAQLRRARKRCPVQVFGTDANDNALAHARNGVYPIGIAHQVPPEYLSRYFQEIKETHNYQVSSELRESVIFGVHNLLVHPPFSRLDLVTCRNLLIYLDPEMQQRLLLVFHFALRADGYLFLGSAETIGANDKLYRPVARKWRIYRRIGTTPHDQIAWYPDPMTRGTPWSGNQPIPAMPTRGTYLASAARNALVDHFAPAAVVINARMEPLYFSGPTERFLLQRHLAPPTNLLPLLPEAIRSKLPAAVRQVQGGKATASIGNVKIRGRSRAAAIRVDVVPILAKPGNAKSQLYLVAFQEEPRRPIRSGLMPGTASAANSRLQDELRMTREDLVSTVDQLETSNEELRASHEEIVSVNEELQSMNEELESSKEELQSVNEELNTVNTQLQDKISQLEVSNNDLRNLLASGEMATVCLDRSFRIKWFRPATHKLFNLLPTDVGRPIGDLSPIAADPTMLEDARAVLQTLIPRSTEIEHNGVHLRRIFPYRTADERIDGVVITFADITDAKRQAQEEIEAKVAANELLERRVRERSEELSRISRELALAEVHERQKIARDLHDGLGQELNAAVIKLDALRTTTGKSKSKAALEELATLLGHIVREMRSLTAQINPPVLDQLGLVPAIEWLGEEMRKTFRLEVSIEDDSLPKPLDHVAASIVFRAVRELLINVVRHANVKTARVSARRTHGALKIQVIDQGVGLALDGPDLKSTTNLGLATIRERVAYIGGALTLEGGRGRGTTATIEIPLSAT